MKGKRYVWVVADRAEPDIIFLFTSKKKAEAFIKRNQVEDFEEYHLSKSILN